MLLLLEKLHYLSLLGFSCQRTSVYWLIDDNVSEIDCLCRNKQARFFRLCPDKHAVIRHIYSASFASENGLAQLAHLRLRNGMNKERNNSVGFSQYHEPANELPQEARTFARMIASLTEEAEAIGWYEQRLALEHNQEARAIMINAQGEEFKHFGMDLEFLLRQKPKWRVALQDILFKEGDIVAHGEEAEEAEDRQG